MRAETWATSATAVSAAADEPYASGGSGGGGGASRAALREARFRAIFKLPPSETIAFEVTCAHYSRNERLLLHGRMYASPLFICFYSRIFSHRTQQVIPLRRIVAIEAKHSCFCIPDAIELTVAGESGTTGTDTHLFFASFQGRDRAIATLRRLWSSSGEKQPAAPSLAPPGRKKGVSSAGRAGSSSPKDVCSTARQTAGELSGAVLAGVTEEGEVEGVHEGPEEPVTMSELVAFTIPACTSCADVFDEFWADGEAFTASFRGQRGDSSIDVGAWGRAASSVVGRGAVRTRVVRWVAPVKGSPIGPSCTAVSETQRHRWLGERGTKSEQLLIETDAVYDDIPYGDCFQVATEFSFQRQQAAARVSAA